ncbi:LysE family translocator [Rhodobium gokarnense]|uniref:Threonine/homoserine/homoserine lactone efflux protein n=1 Tax=Rhodobium gokarnense TaxID=364296 RepID=A0ABT3HBV1_9HYPH|nr:LysE family translocator [Rhodobium gokarnense]MCW2307866.1 threonine/homoserine/homoserine lactone efflux protein [Rhodobium gokarnense]
MTIEIWLAFVAAATVILILPGPTVLLVVAYALGQGRRVALAMVAGVALGDFVAMTVSMAGLGAVMLASATLFTVMKWIGAAYLVYLGIKLWRADARLPALGAEDAPPVPLTGAFTHAFAVTALNPKSIAFFIAFVPQFITHDAPLLPQLVVLETTFVGLAAVNAAAYAVLGDQLRKRMTKPSVLRWLNRAGASCLVGMGAATAAMRNG